MQNSSSDPHVLVFVDDELSILNALKRELREWARSEGLAIETFSSAFAARRFLEERHKEVAVLVSDLRMPEKLGSDFLLEVGKNWPNIITMLLTGFSETEELMKAVRAGIHAYILKPWESDYLQTELSKALELRRMKARDEAYKETIVEELRWAGEMQRAILKPALIRSDGVEFRSSYRPAPGLYVGGDYYDVVNLSQDRFLILIGDVAGHGLRAAFVTGILKAVIYPEYLRGVQARKFSPAAFLSWLNDRMNFELRQATGLIITFFAGVIDLKEMSFTYANAGQNHPWLISGGIPRELPVSGSGLGFAASVMHVDKTEQLAAGDVIFAYTDGLVEAGMKTGAEDPVRLEPILRQEEYGSEYHGRILESALQASGAPDFEDDVTIVTARLI